MGIQTYFVSGKVYVRVSGSDSAFEWPGLVDTIDVAISEQQISLPDRTQSGGGNYDEIRRIESVELTMNHREFHPATLARALFGDASAVAGAAVVAEEHEVDEDSFVPLDHPGPYTLVSVTDDATSPGAIAAAGNYEVRPGGIYVLAGAPDIADGDTIKVSYTHPAYDRVEALTTTPPVLEIFFEGVNEADSDNPRTARFYRVKLGAAAQLSLLSGDDFGALSLTGEVLKDSTKTGGVSQYFRMDSVASA